MSFIHPNCVCACCLRRCGLLCRAGAASGAGGALWLLTSSGYQKLPAGAGTLQTGAGTSHGRAGAADAEARARLQRLRDAVATRMPERKHMLAPPTHGEEGGGEGGGEGVGSGTRTGSVGLLGVAGTPVDKRRDRRVQRTYAVQPCWPAPVHPC
eukprot:366380-Chlamydomonas_euryale.AAC.15